MSGRYLNSNGIGLAGATALQAALDSSASLKKLVMVNNPVDRESTCTDGD